MVLDGFFEVFPLLGGCLLLVYPGRRRGLRSPPPTRGERVGDAKVAASSMAVVRLPSRHANSGPAPANLTTCLQGVGNDVGKTHSSFGDGSVGSLT